MAHTYVAHDEGGGVVVVIGGWFCLLGEGVSDGRKA